LFQFHERNSNLLRFHGQSPIVIIKAEQIEIDPDRLRKSINEKGLDPLMRSIKKLGLIHPLVVRKSSENKYVVVTGQRRFLAVLKAGLEEIPCILLGHEIQQSIDLMEFQLLENLLREDINVIDESIAFQTLEDNYNYNQKQLVEKFNRSEAYISGSLKLLKKLSPEERLEIKKSELFHRSLVPEALKVEDPELRKEILSGKYTVKEARKKIKAVSQKAGRPKNYCFTYIPEEKNFRLTIRFIKPQVEKAEIIKSLEAAILHLEKKPK